MKRSNGGDALGGVPGKLARMAVGVVVGLVASEPVLADSCSPSLSLGAARTKLSAAQRNLDFQEAELRSAKSERARQQRYKGADDEKTQDAKAHVSLVEKEVSDAEKAVEEAESEVRKARAQASFADLKFGVGIGVALGDSAQVSEATIEGETQLVRVKKRERDQVRLVFEAHKYVAFGAGCQWGHGPFVSVQTGGDGASLNSLGLGWMFGMRDDVDGIDGAGWSLGIGYYLDNSVRKLGDGIHENQPLPAGDQLRFKEESDGGFMLVFSRTF